jgi:hypothetical protein
MGDSGLRLLGHLLDASHDLAPDELVAAVTRAGQALDAEDVAIYLVDYEQTLLVPLADRRGAVADQGVGRRPLPGVQLATLQMTHGWPGSVIELLETVGPLTDPTAHGGTPEDAFHPVLPSLPSYGFSGEPVELGWGSSRIARAWSQEHAAHAALDTFTTTGFAYSLEQSTRSQMIGYALPTTSRCTG